jgi:hypothetical protein
VIGDRKRLEKAGAIAGAMPEKLDCIDLGLVPRRSSVRQVSAAAGEAAYRYNRARG